jgi:Skp family chaperone for outer membrane proteins
VKRTILLLTGLLALAAAAYVGGRLRAQTTGAAPAPEPRTRIALINLLFVLEKYERGKALNEEMKLVAKPFQEKDQLKVAERDKMVKEAQDPKCTAERREQLEKDVRQIERQRQDNKAEYDAAMNKKSDESLKILYMEVQDAVTRYAQAHNFELVLHFNDATTRERYYSGPFIRGKMQPTVCMPLYAARGMDISEQVVNDLNAAYRRTAGTPAPAAGAPAGAAPATPH